MIRLLEIILICLDAQFDCGHFKKANEWLEMRYGEKGVVNWNLDGSAMTKQTAAPVRGVGVPTKGEQSELNKESSKVAIDKADADFGDDFDADEEEAMIQAAIEIENQERNTV